jgi:hypothetical protein
VEHDRAVSEGWTWLECARVIANDVRSHAATVGSHPEALETQAKFNRELTEQALAPMRQVFEGLKQAATTTRAAGEALKEAGDLLTQQAIAMDQALSFSWPFLEVTTPPSEGSAKAE